MLPHGPQGSQLRQAQWKKVQYEKGYPWFFFHIGRAQSIGLLVTLIIVGASGAFYLWYNQSGNDAAPDSNVGLGYGIAGTLCFMLAALLYTLRRHSRKRSVGQLNAALNWHIFFAAMGIAFVIMHSFGNFNPRTGTFALYGLIALVVSGFVGSILDRLMPRLITREVGNFLTARGEDRIETISQNLQAVGWQDPGRDQSRPYASFDMLEGGEGGPVSIVPWDLAYISLEMRTGVIDHALASGRDAPQHPDALIPQARQHIADVQEAQKALEREQFYRYVIHYWRLLHIALALLALLLIIWHLIYVVQLFLHLEATYDMPTL
jgi:hypothetical protein